MQIHLRKRYKHFNRYREIANVLAKHGFGYMLNQLGLAEFLKFSWDARREKPEKSALSRASRLRLVMEELGPTFIKLGQLLSTRSDMLAPEFVTELSKLQEEVPPFSYGEVKERVQQELGRNLKEIFTSFEKEPMAAASIGQVHRATLYSGDKVVVKVQRPGIQKTMEVDIEILYDLAGLVERHTVWGKNYRLVEVVEEFDHMLHQELNFTMEGKHAETFTRNFARDNNVVIPAVYWEYTTSKIITLEMVEGAKLSYVDAAGENGINGTVVARRLIDAMLKQVFIHGFFHADPHPGNVAILPVERIAFLDFGIVGSLDEEDRDKITNLVLGIINRNTAGVVRAVNSLGVVPASVDFSSLRRDIDKLRQKYLEVPLQEISISESLGEVMQVAFKHNIRVRTEFTMLVKALVTLEGITARLDPGLSIIEAAKPLSKQVITERYSLERLRKIIVKNFYEYHIMFSRLPGHLNYLLDLVSSGELTIKVENPEMNSVIKQLHKLANRLSLSVVTAGLLMTSALLAGKSITFWGIPVVHVSLVSGLLVGLLLAFSMARSS